MVRNVHVFSAVASDLLRFPFNSMHQIESCSRQGTCPSPAVRSLSSASARHICFSLACRNAGRSFCMSLPGLADALFMALFRIAHRLTGSVRVEVDHEFCTLLARRHRPNEFSSFRAKHHGTKVTMAHGGSFLSASLCVGKVTDECIAAIVCADGCPNLQYLDISDNRNIIYPVIVSTTLQTVP